MAFRPLQDRVLVKRVDSDTVTEGGIIIPDGAQEKPNKGVVVSVGDGKLLEDGYTAKVSVKEGDVVLFGKYSGTELKIGGEVHLILKEDELLGVEE